MSVYPNSLDQNFPGYPYTDYQEYVDSTQANAWVQAIQATESTIGYGNPGTQYNPLYSRWYVQTYPTLTARIDNIENAVVHAVQLNTTDSIIQPVANLGIPSSAGHSGVAADAAHVHADGIPPSSMIAVGGVILWPGLASTFPANYLACNGQFVSTSNFGTLFNVVGYRYGGSGASFQLPSYNDRFPIGAGGSFAPSVGNAGGSSTIAVANLPLHGHPATVNDPSHMHESRLDTSDTGGSYGFQSVYLTNEQYSSLILPRTDLNPAIGGHYASWSPGNYPWDTGHQNRWAGAATGVTVTVGGTGGGSPYNPSFLGTYFLIRAA
jgi:microcystin-dependent protein